MFIIPKKIPKAEPSLPPAFFTPEKANPDEKHYFEEGLVESVLADHWRCSWLGEIVEARVEANTSRAQAAERALLESANIEDSRFSDFQFKQYLTDVEEFARSQGVSAEEVEYEVDCAGIELEGVAK